MGAPSRTFSEAINVCLKNYFNFSGRASRSEYWYFVLFTFLAGIITGFIDAVIFGWDFNTQTYGPTNSILTILVIIPSLAVTWRRLHDVNQSGWIIGFFYLLLIMYVIFITTFIVNIQNKDNNLLLISVSSFIVIMYAIGIFVYLCSKGHSGLNKYDDGYRLSNNENSLGVFNDDDSQFYLSAMRELKENRDEAFWAKCFAENNGDNQTAEAAYIKYKALLLKNKNAVNTEFIQKAEFLYKNLRYEDKSYKNSKYLLLENGIVALRKSDGDKKIVHIYENEDVFKKSIDSSNIEYGLKDTFVD